MKERKIMIYTVTFNPALDYSVCVKNLNIGLTNRTECENIFPGGKGLNVSAVLSNLGIENIALGFVAGFTGDEIERLFNSGGYKSDFIKLKKGLSRINVKIKSEKETEINASGPEIDNEAIDTLMYKLSKLEKDDTIVLAGSIPRSLPDTLYCDIMSQLADKGIRFVVDATGDLLIESLKFKPFLIKPNNHELGEIFGTKINTQNDAVKYAVKLKEMGAENVLVSLGGDGAVLASGDGNIIKCNAPKGKVINSVGAGDSMIAGFLAGWLGKGEYDYALKLGIASGSASAFSGSLAEKSDIYNIFKEL